MSRRVFINLIAFVGMFVLMLFWAVNNIVSFDFIEKPYQLEAEFAATAGVTTNSEVAYLGVHYGEVRSVESTNGMVMVSMNIDRGKEIPEGSVARIFRKSAIGEPYIDFYPPSDFTDATPMMAPDSVIPLDRTTVPLEFSELLRAASRVLAAVDPEQTRTLIHELAVALNGRGETLRDLTISSDALLQTFADKTELLDQLSANSTQLTRTVTEHRGSISSAVDDLASLAETLRTIQPDTEVLLTRGTELLGQTADLVSDIKGNVDCVLKDLDDVIDLTSTDANLATTARLLDNGPTGLRYFFLTRDTEPGGLWVRVSLQFHTENPPTQYVPHTELPAVPVVPPCVSTLSTGGVRFDSTGGVPVEPTSSNLPATGAETTVALLVFVLAGAIFTVVARRGSHV